VELAKCLQNNGFQCQIYWFPDSPEEIKLHYQMLQIYIESGIPLLLVLGGNRHGHAVLAIGHEEDNTIYDVQNYTYPKGSSWVDVSSLNKKIVLIDDNMPPYQLADSSSPTAHYPKPEMRSMNIKSFIASLPIHMFLVAEKAYALMEHIFNTKKVGLQANGGKWITRLMLTGSRSFKNFVFNKDDKLELGLKNLLLHLPLPRFIWMCEVYNANEFVKNGYCTGLLIIDATSDGKSLASVLWYTLDTNMFSHNNIMWEEENFETIVPFRMSTYRHNLKGAWNKWI
jgi:hypothetical protein